MQYFRPKSSNGPNLVTIVGRKSSDAAFASVQGATGERGVRTVDGQSELRSVARSAPVSEDTKIVPPAKLPSHVKEVRLFQRLLRRDMERKGLGIRAAAKQGPIALGTLCRHLDERRVTERDKQPKRHMRRATLLELRSLAWAGPRTKRLAEARLQIVRSA